VAEVRIDFLLQWRAGGGWSRESGRQWWCKFNTSVSTREARRRDKVLSKAEAASSSWHYEKETWNDATAWQRRPEERQHWGGEREEMMPIGLT
jgi:hypothetical protein